MTRYRIFVIRTGRICIEVGDKKTQSGHTVTLTRYLRESAALPVVKVAVPALPEVELPVSKYTKKLNLV